MARLRKTRDTWQLWVNYGQGWEHEITEDTFQQARERKQEYRANCPEYPTRIRYHRERIVADPPPVAFDFETARRWPQRSGPCDTHTLTV